MQLHHTKVVPSANDALWVLPPALPDFAGLRLLVISAPFERGSAEEQTLLRMMAACKLAHNEYAVIQMEASERIAWQALAAAGAPMRVLLLGIAPGQLAVSAMFGLNRRNNFLGCTFIPGLALAQLESNPDMKRELWKEGLQPCFGG